MRAITNVKNDEDRRNVDENFDPIFYRQIGQSAFVKLESLNSSGLTNFNLISSDFFTKLADG